MTISWIAQRRKVDFLSHKLRLSTVAERQGRDDLKSTISQSFASIETMFWISATGAIWISRRRKAKEQGEAGNPLLEIMAAIMIVARWRSMPEKVSSAFKLEGEDE